MFSSIRQSAFTLIELLIVVAIIAILAAIAVPNFLEAQTRAKVSRIKADMRSLGTAVESYRVDNNAYPVPSGEDGGLLPPNPTVEWFETRMPVGLTTPIAYMSSFPRDIFAATEGDELPLLHYATRACVSATEPNTDGFDNLIKTVLGDFHKTIEYDVLSHGPDKDHDFAETEPPTPGDPLENPEPALYDPTNGTVSNGDVIFWGPGIGFRN